jgi:hypothetical protein
MTDSLSAEKTRILRMRAQWLDPLYRDPVQSPNRVLKEVCGVQAQEAPAAALALRARSAGLTSVGVEQARVEERSIVRTWCQRGTLHLLAAEDVGWLLDLLGPVFIAGGRRRNLELGLDEDTLTKGIHILRNALSNRGPLTVKEIASLLGKVGLPSEGQAPIHLVGRAALEGILCAGPDSGSRPTYVLVDDWLGRERMVKMESAQAELAQRYLEAYAPAGPEDLAAWSGLPVSRARSAWKEIEKHLVEVEIEAAGRPAWILKKQTPWLNELSSRPPVVRLVPRFDTYLLGYSGRDLAVPSEHARRLHPGGGILRPALLAGGRVLAIWSSQRRRGRLEVTVEPFEKLPPEVIPGLELEVQDMGRFLDVEAELKFRPQAANAER